MTVTACMMNDGTDTPYYPARYRHTIAVGATDTDDTRCQRFFWGGGSNYGSHLDVVAPGNYIYGLSARSDNVYGTYWGGTSQATAFVTGVLALLAGQDTSRTPDELRQLLTESAEDTVGDPFEDTPGWDIFYGYGRVNARRALELATGVTWPRTRETEKSTPLASLTAFPNPFNDATTLTYRLPKRCRVRLSLFASNGKRVRVLELDTQTTGVHRLRLGLEDLSSGVYLVQLSAGEHRLTTKLVLVK